MAMTNSSITDSSTPVVLNKPATDTLVSVQIYGTYTGVTFTLDGSTDGTNYIPLVATKVNDGASVNSTITPGSSASVGYEVVCPNYTYFRVKPTAWSTGTAYVYIESMATPNVPSRSSVTSGGTFSSPTLSGTVTVTGTTTFSVMPLIPTATVAAAGTVQGDAAAITTGFTLVTGSTNAGVILPTAVAGLQVIVKNNVGGNMKVWPNTSDAINAISANAAFTMATLTSCMFTAYDATTWYSTPLVAS